MKIDFTDIKRDDIFKAMEKYNQLEKDQELEVSRAARKYTLFWESYEYPHKYIVGIAYGIHRNQAILESSSYHATGNDKKSAEWCLNRLGFELFADAKFKQYLEQNYPNETTKNTYYNDLRKAIKILQKIDLLKDRKLSEIFEHVLNSKMNFEEYDKAQQQLGYNDKQLFTTLASKIRVYLKSIEENNTDKSDQGEEMFNISKQPLNQILYGPPGTGKTYNTINRALEIVFEKEDVDKQIQHKFQGYEVNKFVSEIIIILRQKSHTTDDRKVLMTIFDYYKPQIVFTTFHQSYGYEEFVEGIKAQTIIDEETKKQTITYDVEDGIFKRLCEQAKEIKSFKQFIYDFDEKINIWKISLGDTQNSGDDYIYDYCINNKKILLGFGEGINFDDCNSRKEIAKKLEDLKKYSYPPTALDTLKNKMKKDDVVLVSYGNRKLRAIAKITGDYEFLEEEELGTYVQSRDVEWLLVPEEPFTFEKVLKKQFSQMSIYDIKNNTKIDNLKELLSKKTKDIVSNEKNYVLIIDEINRGNISKIFGELITLIEDSKRIGKDEEIRVSLPYSRMGDDGKGFGVPSNLYIIGTMNTADRSIALMDTALRRRFAFTEMMPALEILSSDDSKVKDYYSDRAQANDLIFDKINIRLLLKKINQRVEYLYDRDHTIGHAYFLSLKGIKDEKQQKVELDNIFRNKIIPLLQEYFYDDWEKIQIVLGDHPEQFKKKNIKNNIDTYQFIQSNVIKEEDILGFDHPDIENNSVKYKINSEFLADTYIKIYGIYPKDNIDDSEKQTDSAD